MNRFKLLFFLVLALAIQHARAQDKMLSMEDAIIGQWRHLYPENIHGFWQPGTSNLTYKEKNNLIQFDAEGKSSEVVLKLSAINQALAADGYDTLKGFPYPKWLTEKKLFVRRPGRAFVFNRNNKEIESFYRFIEGDMRFDYVSDLSNEKIAVTNDNDLYIATPKNRITVAKSDDENIVYGQAVSRREFGISKGTFWSPKGKYLAYYINNMSDVKRYPIVDITKREAEAEMIPYPMAGMKSEHISLGVFDTQTGKTVYIEDDDPYSEKYLTNISWGPNEEYIYIQVLNRGQNHMKLNKYSVETGELLNTLFEEKHEKYVEPYHKLIFLPNDPNSFLYQMRKDGYNHLYHFNTSGELINKITSGAWEVTDVLGFGPNAEYLYYISTEESPIERHVYKVKIDKPKKKTRLTNSAGTHSATLSGNGKYIFDRYSAQNVPRVVQLIDTEKGKKHVMLEADNPLKDYKLGETTIGKIKSADGKTDLYYRMIKPANFDPDKKYPAIIYVYGGPHAQLVSNSWLGGARMWQHYMAQQGYVMLTVDNRGSANRGLEFENVIHRQCGQAEMADQLKGVELLKSFDYVDAERIGIHGWSYGGFMTTSLITNYPDIFKVGVAGGPVIDWKYYEVMYGERYMDSPQENPEGYQKTSLIPMAKELKRKLLIVHGFIDPTVVQQHSLVFVRECVKANVPVDYFVYPRAEHNVRGKDRIHLMQKVTDYFEDFLK